MTIEELRRRLDTMKGEKKDYSELSVLELINELYNLRHKLMYGLDTDCLTNELYEWVGGAGVDVYDMTDELTGHIEVLGEMKAVCEEILRAVCDKEFDY